MAGLRDSVMILYEISDIQPGRSFLARDLICGGEPVRVSERAATKTLKRNEVRMKCIQSAPAVLFLTVIGGGAFADTLALPAGRYEVGFRLELPHLERYGTDQTAIICVDPANLQDGIPLPLFGGNAVFANCTANSVRRKRVGFEYDIVCAGRAAARAKAAYTLTPGRFRGRIAMVLGAKNMTMTEVQRGRRLGSCNVADRSWK